MPPCCPLQAAIERLPPYLTPLRTHSPSGSPRVVPHTEGWGGSRERVHQVRSFSWKPEVCWENPPRADPTMGTPQPSAGCTG